MQNPRPPSRVQWTDLVPKAGRPRRPGLITASAFLMAVSGVFGVLITLGLLMDGGPSHLSPRAQHVLTVIAGVALALAVLQVITGILILGQSHLGRTLGIVLSALGMIGAVLHSDSRQPAV